MTLTCDHCKHPIEWHGRHGCYGISSAGSCACKFNRSGQQGSDEFETYEMFLARRLQESCGCGECDVCAAAKCITNLLDAFDAIAQPSSAVSQVIAEAERLLKDITPGEWCISDFDGAIVAYQDGDAYPERIAETMHYRNDDFIAAAPRLVRQLLALLSPGSPGRQDPEPR